MTRGGWMFLSKGGGGRCMTRGRGGGYVRKGVGEYCSPSLPGSLGKEEGGCVRKRMGIYMTRGGEGRCKRVYGCMLWV